MQRVVIFSEPTPIYHALKMGLSPFRFMIEQIDTNRLIYPDERAVNSANSAFLVVVLPGLEGTNCRLACASAVRLRCAPYCFTGPIAVLNPWKTLESEFIDSINASGIYLLCVSEAVSQIAAIAIQKKQWATSPSIDCRPVWALKEECASHDHRTKNVFRRIADKGTDYEKSWMHEMKNILLPS
jgi:hypothetical protein